MNAVGCHTSIFVFNLLLVLSASIKYVVSTHKQDSENLFPFLGYLQGFKLGQNIALELPPFVLSPIVIVPSMKQYQDLIPESNTNEKTDYHARNMSYSKLSSNFTSELDTKQDKINDSNERDFLVKEKRLAESETATDSVRQAIGDDSNIDATTEKNEVLNTTSTSEVNNSTVQNVINNTKTTITAGPYPSALYNNDFLNNLTITMQIGYNITLPTTENNWQNFSLSSNISNVVKSTFNSTNNTAEFAVFPTKQSSVLTNSYPYPNAIFNSMADRISITTNPYLDVGSNLPPSYDDRWQSSSSLTKLYPNSGFRPLAGMYYDGFLHKSLNKKTGFIPFDGTNNYNE